jgi:predicted transcriptional regulator
MQVLLSIKPEFVEEIFNGTKKFEYRKAIFKNKEVKTIVIYATMPIGKIVGEFEIDDIIEKHPHDIWEETKQYSGVSKEFYYQYFKGRDKGYAIGIKRLKKYKKPRCPYKLYDKFTAPQSFKYL